mmetsp:Transcript_48428/g.134710  ORF Transcript_48428/g.134710 Transcript_48428/m.134710 type:complete len:309 (+) Transcript_48428:248-1174(+)
MRRPAPRPPARAPPALGRATSSRSPRGTAARTRPRPPRRLRPRGPATTGSSRCRRPRRSRLLLGASSLRRPTPGSPAPLPRGALPRPTRRQRNWTTLGARARAARRWRVRRRRRRRTTTGCAPTPSRSISRRRRPSSRRSSGGHRLARRGVSRRRRSPRTRRGASRRRRTRSPPPTRGARTRTSSISRWWLPSRRATPGARRSRRARRGRLPSAEPRPRVLAPTSAQLGIALKVIEVDLLAIVEMMVGSSPRGSTARPQVRPPRAKRTGGTAGAPRAAHLVLVIRDRRVPSERRRQERERSRCTAARA